MPAVDQPITQLYLTPDSRELRRHLRQAYEGLLGQNEKNRLERYQGRRRAEYLVGRAALRTALSETSCLGSLPASWTLAEKPNHPPDIPQARDEGLHFSLSHSKGVVAVLVTNTGPCGVDIEHHKARTNFLELAEHGFHPDEVAEMRGLPDPEKLLYFYQLWSLKEAYIKASDSTLFSDSMATTRFTLAPANDDTNHTALNQPRGYWENRGEFSLAMVAKHPARQITTGFPLADQTRSKTDPTCFSISLE